MPWTRFTLTTVDIAGGLESRLVDAFKRWHKLAGAPHDAAIFRESQPKGGAVLYFSPAAINITASVMAQLGIRGGPVACDKPDHVDALVFGTEDAKKRLLDE